MVRSRAKVARQRPVCAIVSIDSDDIRSAEPCGGAARAAYHGSVHSVFPPSRHRSAARVRSLPSACLWSVELHTLGCVPGPSAAIAAPAGANRHTVQHLCAVHWDVGAVSPKEPGYTSSDATGLGRAPRTVLSDSRRTSCEVTGQAGCGAASSWARHNGA